MTFVKRFFLSLFFLIFLLQCKKENLPQKKIGLANKMQYAKGLGLYVTPNFSILQLKGSQKKIYVLKKKNVVIPDSLKQYPTITIPLKKIVLTSTTHIPELEMLGVENTIIGFPNLDYISSEKTRKLINDKKIQDLGSNESLNIEILLSNPPNVVINSGVNTEKVFDNLEKNNISVLINNDWQEQSPLGKAEWIKFFGALYDLNLQAETIFKQIESEYKKALVLSQNAIKTPTVLSGSCYQNQWYVPQGKSWMSAFFKDAKSNYLWKNSKGFASMPLTFETVLEKAQNTDFWIGPGNFTSLQELAASTPHCKFLKAFKNKKIYSYAVNKGVSGGILYFETATIHPDWVLKDLIAIFHPELLPNYKLVFFTKLK